MLYIKRKFNINVMYYSYYYKDCLSLLIILVNQIKKILFNYKYFIKYY